MDIDRSIHPTPLLRSTHGSVYSMEPGRYLVGYRGNWLGLTLEQLAEFGNTLGRMLQCPCRKKHFEEGLLIHSPAGSRRLVLDPNDAEELRGLVNDLLLLIQAQTQVGPFLEMPGPEES